MASEAGREEYSRNVVRGPQSRTLALARDREQVLHIEKSTYEKL